MPPSHLHEVFIGADHPRPYQLIVRQKPIGLRRIGAEPANAHEKRQGGLDIQEIAKRQLGAFRISHRERSFKIVEPLGHRRIPISLSAHRPTSFASFASRFAKSR